MLRTRNRILGVLVVAALLVASLALPAFAATTNGWDSNDVVLIEGQSGPVLLVSGTLPSSVSLPAKVSLAVPTGAEILWAGEILGGDASKDPTVQYTVKSGAKYDTVEFTLTKAHTGQVEISATNSVAQAGSGKTATVEWTAPSDVPSVRLGVQLPSGATVTGTTGGAEKEANPEGTSYGRVFDSVKSGKKLAMSVTYTGGTSGSSGTASGGTGTTTTTASSGRPSLLIAIVALAVILGVTYVAFQRVSPKTVEAEDEPAAANDRDQHDAEDDEFDAFQVED